MKRLFWVCVALCVIAAGALFAAVPLNKVPFKNTGDKTVDNQHTGTWDVLDSVVVIRSDSGSAVVTVSGIAVLAPGERLYLGLGNDSANQVSYTNTAPNSNLDTCIVEVPMGARGVWRIPFSFSFGISGNGALTDTIYWNAACGSSAAPVNIEDGHLKVDVGDKAAEDV